MNDTNLFDKDHSTNLFPFFPLHLLLSPSPPPSPVALLVVTIALTVGGLLHLFKIMTDYI